MTVPRLFRFFLFTLLFSASFFVVTQSTFAAAITWDGDTDINWSSGDNWVGGVAPGVGDVATFDATSAANPFNSPLVDASINVQGIDINVGYTGTISQGAASTVTIGSGNYDQAAGTFTGLVVAMTVNGNFTISGGTFTATTATTTITGNFVHSAGVFAHNTGTVTLTGSGSTTNLTGATAQTDTFYNLTINKTGGEIITMTAGDIFTVLNPLTLSDGAVSTGTLNPWGAVSVDPGYDGGTATLNFGGASTPQTFALASPGLYDGDITINKSSSSGIVQLTTALTMDAASQDLTVTTGIFNLAGSNFEISGIGSAFTIAATGAFHLQGGETVTGVPDFADGADVVYNGTGASYTMKSWDYTATDLTVQGTAATTVFIVPGALSLSTLTILGGKFQMSGYSLNVSGVFTNNDVLLLCGNEASVTFGTMDVDSGTVNYVGDQGGTVQAYTIWDFGGVGTDYFNLKINDPNATVGNRDTFALGANVTVAGDMNVKTTSLAQGTYTVNTATLTMNGGTFTGGSGAITMTGNFSMTSGTFTSTSNTLQISGGWTHTAGGTFTHNSGIVELTGGSATIDVNSTESFNNLTINKTDGQTLTILGADVLVPVGTLTLTNGAVSGSTMRPNGNVVVGAGYDGGTTILQFQGSGAQSFDLTAATGNYNGPIIVNKSAGTVTLGSALTLDATTADFMVSLGTFSTGNYELTTLVGSDVLVNGGTFNAGSSIMTTNGTFTVSSGTFNGNTSTSAINGAFALSGGTFSASSGTTSFASSFTHSGGTFTHNSGTVQFNGAAATVNLTGAASQMDTFYNLTITKTTANTLTMTASDTFTVVNLLTLTDGAVAVGMLDAQGNVTIGGGYDGGTATLEFVGSAAQTFTLADAGLYDGTIVVNKPAETVTLLSGLTLDAATADLIVADGTFTTDGQPFATSSGSDITVMGGTFNSGASVMTIGGEVTVSGGTFNGNTSTPTFSGTVTVSSGAYNGNTSAPTFSGLTISGTGVFTASSGTTTIPGVYTNSGGTFTHNSGTVTFTGGTVGVDVNVTETFFDLTINKDGQMLEIAPSDTLVVEGALNLTNGLVSTVEGETGTLNAQGGVTVGAGYAGGTATLLFSGTAAQTFTLTGAEALYNGPITVNKASETVTLASGLTLDAATADFTLTLGTFSTGNQIITTSAGSDITINGGIFNSGSSTMTIGGAVTVSSGTYNANTSVPTVSGAFEISGGAYNGNTSTGSFTGAFTISDGTFTATSGTTTFSSTYTHTSGGTFAHNNGIVKFIGNDSGININTSETFNDFTVEKTDGQTLTLASDDSFVILGALTLTDGAVATWSGTLDSRGGTTVASTYDGGDANLNFSGVGTQIFDLTGATGNYNGLITIANDGGTVTLGSALLLDAAAFNLGAGTFSTGNYDFTTTAGRNITVSGGIFNSGSSTMTIGGGLTISETGEFIASSGTTVFSEGYTHSGGTFTHNSGLVQFTGSNATVNLSGATAQTDTFFNLTIDKTDDQSLTMTSGDIFVVEGTLLLAQGVVETGTLNPRSAVQVNAGYAGGTAMLLFSGTAAQTFTLTGAEALYNGDITVNKASGTVTLGSALTMDGVGQDLTMTSGGFNTSDASDYALSIAGNLAANGGTLTLNGSTVNLDGNLTLGGGTIFATSGAWTMAGNLTRTSGTFTHNSGTVTLDGTDQIIVGAFIFGNLTKSVTTARTLTLPASLTTTIAGTLTLGGTSGNLLSLVSSTPDTEALIDPQGTQTVSYLDVQDSDNVQTLYISCHTGCLDSGNNSEWSFGPVGVTVTESSASTDVTEGGATDTYTVVLDAVPTDTVTITISNSAQTTSSPSTTLTFTTSNWFTAQTVTVTAVNNSLDDGSRTGTITHVATSDDDAYDGISVASVVANVTDEDEPAPTPTGGTRHSGGDDDEDEEDEEPTEEPIDDTDNGQFTDLIGHWAESAVEELAGRNVVEGKSEGLFDPNAQVTRAEFLKIALLNQGFEVTGAPATSFIDVNLEDWSYNYISFAQANDVIDGYEDGSFMPNASITRAEALVIIMKLANIDLLDVDLSEISFTDVHSSDWFAAAVVVASHDGIVVGYEDGTFAPNSNMTRAEAAVIAERVYSILY